MKKRISILSIFLALILCLSFVAGCSCNGDDDSSDESYEGNRLVSKREFTDGVHDYTAPERDDYFILNGVSEYKIVAPSSATLNKNLEVGIQDFNSFLKEATGVSLPIIFEDTASTTFTHDANQKYISIGQTKLLESAGLEGDFEELKVHGYRIKTVDNNVYLYGAHDRAGANAVYGFLNIMLNYELFSIDLWEIDHKTTVKMRDFDVVDIPDGMSTNAGYAAHSGNELVNQTRFRIGGISTYNIGDYEHGETEVSFHNVLQLVSPNNPDVKNEWLSDTKDQLCYTAHGDDELLNEMVLHVTTIIKKSLVRNSKFLEDAEKDYPAFVTITCEDTGNVCTCDACAIENEKYGSPAGPALLFCNRVMTELENWMNTEGNEAYKNDNLKLIMFAYSGYIKCPATYNEDTKKYELNAGLELHPKVGTYLVNETNTRFNIYSEKNDIARENFVAWTDVVNALTLWTWDNNFAFPVALWDTFEFYNDEGYSFLLAGKPTTIFFEVGGDKIRTGFGMLKMYLQYKKLWDCSQKIDDLIAKWFTASFGAASDKMMELFTAERLFERVLYGELGAIESGANIVTATDKTKWSLPTLKEWVAILDEAHAINERVNKTLDPEKYEIIKKNIDREYVYPAYALLKIFSKADDAVFYKKITDYLKENDKYFSKDTALVEFVDKYRNA